MSRAPVLEPAHEVPTLHYSGGYKYQLRKHAVEFDCPELAAWQYFGRFLSLTNGVMRFEVGYAWDGLSGPMIDTPDAMPAGLGHDGGAEISRRLTMSEEDREDFVRANNAFFHRLLRATLPKPEERRWWHGRTQWRRFRSWYAWRAVSLVDGYADPASRKTIQVAP